MPQRTNHRQQTATQSGRTEEDLFSAYETDRSVALRNEIVERYLYIASIVSRRFSGRGIDADDLYQVASLALIKAVERFDAGKGVKFSSYATLTVVGEVKNYFRDRLRAIRIPRRGAETARALNAARQALEQQLLRAPTPEELARHMSLTLEEVLEAHETAAAMNVLSIDAIIGEEDFSLKNILGLEDRGYEAFEHKETIQSLLALLNDTERDVVVKRYFKERSQRDLAREMGVSQMTVSRIERKALEKMKGAMNQ
jgi:RNA polymerase sigma-B factor